MTDKLLTLFEQSDGDFVSGEELSQQLGISRTAVWKHIERLRAKGYRFEAVSRKGYRLTGKPDRLDLAALQLKLKTKRFGRQLSYADSVGSTQAAALALIAQGAQEGALAVAEEQTSGRGRMGRQWHSPKGKGLWFSLVLKPRIPIHFAPQLTLLVAVAVCRAIRSLLPQVPVGIKWPNDLLIEGRKVCGILLESSAEDERLQHVVAGIGISVNLQPDDYPPELAVKATSLAIAAGQEVDRGDVLAAVLLELEQLYELYGTQGFAPVKLAWEALSVTLRRSVRIETPQGPIEGMAESIDENGALLVRSAGGELVKCYSGDVEMR